MDNYFWTALLCCCFFSLFFFLLTHYPILSSLKLPHWFIGLSECNLATCFFRMPLKRTNNAPFIENYPSKKIAMLLPSYPHIQDNSYVSMCAGQKCTPGPKALFCWLVLSYSFWDVYIYIYTYDKNINQGFRHKTIWNFLPHFIYEQISELCRVNYPLFCFFQIIF